VAVFGIDFSLQYLSLSDATAITFLSPSVTAVLGYLFANEPFSKKNTVAGGKNLSLLVIHDKIFNVACFKLSRLLA
jgi:hypothetical protein